MKFGVNIFPAEKNHRMGALCYLPHFREVLCINVSRVALNQNNIINKMMLYLKYKTVNMVEFSADPFNLLLRMMNSGHYMLESKWIYCKDGLSVSRLKALRFPLFS